jgi:hypothetical protein
VTHEHDHNSRSYFLDQLWTIAICGAFGVVMILLKYLNVMPIFLDSKFHLPVIWGAIALLILVAIRAVALWIAAGRLKMAGQNEHNHAHDHDHSQEHHHHDHAHQHDHPHDDHSHDHTDHHHEHDSLDDHGHEHDFAPWRYVVLMLPIVLFLFRMPWPDEPDPEEAQNADILSMKLSDAEQSAEDEQKRALYEDKMIRLKGISVPWGDIGQFIFVKMRMTCCYADSYGEPVRILVQPPKNVDVAKLKDKWVKVIGKMGYRQMGSRYITYVKADSVKQIKPPADQFNN